jgi:hypothetical protein
VGKEKNMEKILKKFNELSDSTRVFLLAAIITVNIGAIGPSLISSNSTSAVWIGIALCFFTGVFVVKASKPMLNKLKGDK